MKIPISLLLLLFLTACNDDNSPPTAELPPATISDCEQVGCTVTNNLITPNLNISDEPIVLSNGGSITLE